MLFGSQDTTYPLDDKGSMISDFKHFHKGGVDKAVRTYKTRIKVQNPQEEMSEFIRFTEELRELRRSKKLTDDAAFVIQYPKEDKDGSYFITKCYSVIVDLA